MQYVFFDCETTGLDHQNHELISYALILHVDSKEIQRIYKKVNPEYLDRADPEALKINKYDPQDWTDAISQKKAAECLYNFFQTQTEFIIVGHNPCFDIRFAQTLINRYYSDFKITKRVIDTKHLALAALFPLGLTSCKMDNIRKFLNWPLENAHNALQDALCTKDLFYLCRKDLKKLEWKIPEDAIEYT